MRIVGMKRQKNRRRRKPDLTWDAGDIFKKDKIPALEENKIEKPFKTSRPADRRPPCHLEKKTAQKAAKKIRAGARIFRNTLAVFATALAFLCFSVRIAPEIRAQTEVVALTAAGFILPDGAAQALRSGFQEEKQTSTKTTDEDLNEQEEASSQAEIQPEEKGISSESPSKTESSKESPSKPAESSAVTSEVSSESSSSSKPAIPIEELKIGNSGTQYENIFVKNSNKNHGIDIKGELEKKPPIQIKTDGTPQVLIYHTHTTETYLLWEQEAFQSGTETRSQDNTRNIVLVGDVVEAQLKAAGIGVVHDTTCHDYPAYSGAYTRSATTIQKNLDRYPSIQVTLDIHRDAMGDNSSRMKPTATIDGKKAAQVMIMSGCDDDGSLGFPNWEQNLRLAVRLQKSVADSFPGLARPLNFCARKYNLNMTQGSLLVEFGTEVNTLEEATYSAELFGKALAKTLLELK